MTFDKEDVSTILKLFGVLTTQTEVPQERRHHAEHTIRKFLLDLWEQAPAADTQS